MSHEPPLDYRIALSECGDRGLAAFNRLLEKHQLTPELIDSLRMNAASRAVQNAAAKYAKGFSPAIIQSIVVTTALAITGIILWGSYYVFLKKSPHRVVEQSTR